MLGNLVGIPAVIRPGIKQHKVLLETAIVLMGVRLVLNDIVASGPLIVTLVVGTIVVGLSTVELLTRVFFDVESKTASLLAAGVSICGVSAVVAPTSSIDAKKEHITYAAATILLFDVITIVAFPFAAHALDLTGVQLGSGPG